MAAVRSIALASSTEVPPNFITTSFWRTGAAAYDERVKRALGLRAEDAIVGFVYLGTPAASAGPLPALNVGSHVTRWTGPVDEMPAARR